MNQRAAEKYRQISIETASPGEILLALYDGAIRYSAEAAEAIRAGDKARKGERIGNVLAILGELVATLDHSKAPELCMRLEQLYFYMEERLSHANLHMDTKPIDEVIRLLTTLREGWRGAIAQVKQKP